MTRASVVSSPARVTRIRSSPLPFRVPENTSSPGCLSRGSDSPVMVLSSTLDTPCAMTPSAAIRSPARTTIWSSLSQRRGVDFFLDAVAHAPRAPRHLLHKAVNRGGRATGGVPLQPLAHQHDEHRFGGGQVLAHGQGRDHGDADGEVG